jgi:hypothetical protein
MDAGDRLPREIVLLYRAKHFGRRQSVVDRPPFPGVAHPVSVEAVRSHVVEAGERRIELFHQVWLVAGAVAGDESVASRSPITMDVDRIVELGWLDLRQEARLQDIGDEGLTRRDDCFAAGFGFTGRGGMGAQILWRCAGMSAEPFLTSLMAKTVAPCPSGRDLPPNLPSHWEERGDEATQGPGIARTAPDRHAAKRRLAMTDQQPSP